MQRGRSIHLAALAGALALVAGSGRSAMAAAPTATGLPASFNAVTLGGTSDAQSVSVDASGTWTIKAGGDGLNDSNGADQGIGIYQKLSGNGSLIAHIASTSDPAAQVAVVFRQDPSDQQSPILRNKYSTAGLYQPEIRRTSGDTPQAANANNDSSQVGVRGFYSTGSDTVPGSGVLLSKTPWIGIDRKGPTFRFYSSNDGKAWNLIAIATDSGGSAGKNETVVNSAPLYPADMQVGIEASKNTASAVSTIALDNVTVSSSSLDTAAIDTDATPISWLPMDKSVAVTWNPVMAAGATVTYNVYSFTKSNASDTPMKVNAAPITQSSFVVEKLTDGNQYRFGVTAVVNGVESPLAMPLPAVLSSTGGIGMAIPQPAVDGGLQLYTFGTNTPGTVTVTGTGAAAKYDFMVGGADFWESGDGGSMLAMPMAGDLDVSLRLVQGVTDNGDGWSQGGPTFRQTLDPGSPMVIAVLASNNPMQFKRRFFQNERPHNSNVSQSSGDNSTRPLWGRLVRKGNTFTAYYAEGAATPTTWQPMGDTTATDDSTNTSTINNIGPMPFVGMCWTAHQEGAVAEAVVDNFVIKPAQ